MELNSILIAGAIFAGLGLVGRYLLSPSRSASHDTRGYRNNNPGNIKHGPSRWQGASEDQTDPTFVQFDTPEAGIRAISRTLKTYYYQHNLTTIRQIINRWAPPGENPTENYVLSVAEGVGIDAEVPIDYDRHAFTIASGIIRFELGGMPYSFATVKSGFDSA